ncbi:MAG: cysteine desulfurase [Alphaproteobacteria bacterium]|nr:cysteine desulfurase [Alphaproteobacteria bacterium]
MRTYLDHNATSPLRPAARQAMLAAMDVCGNASSVHAEGRAARHLLDQLRQTIAAALGVLPAMVTFTSGGSEANAMALAGVPVERLLVSAIEHPSVIEAARSSGKTVKIIPVTAVGQVDLEALAGMLPGPTALVSVMLANNETGVIQPVAEVVRLCQRHGAIVHCDAVQALGKIPFNFGVLGVDLLTVNAHKLGGPAGVGALVIRDGLAIRPLVKGGGQESRRRAGTENIPAIAGFAAAVSEKIQDINILRDRLEASLEDETVFGCGGPRLPNTSCIAAPGAKAETLLMALDLDGIAVSSGSACSSGKVAPSHVLAAMGVEPEVARAAIRVSLGWNSTVEDVDRFIAAWKRIRARHKARAAA